MQQQQIQPFFLYGPHPPAVGQIVFVQVPRQQDTDADADVVEVTGSLVVDLLEFPGVTACIPMDEVTFKRKKKKPALIPIGKRFACSVLCVERNENGQLYVDVSKRQMVGKDEQKHAALARFDQAHKLLALLVKATDEHNKEQNTTPLCPQQIVKKLSYRLHQQGHPHPTSLLTTASAATILDLCDDNQQLADCVNRVARLSTRARVALPQHDQGNVSSDDEWRRQWVDNNLEGLVRHAAENVGSLNRDDILHSIQIQVVDLRFSSGLPTTDCALSFLIAVLNFAVTQHRNHTKTLRSVLFHHMKLWYPVIFRLLDKDEVSLFTTKPKVVGSQLELISTLVEWCCESLPNNQAYEGVTTAEQGGTLLRDLLFNLRQSELSLIDEEAVIQWFEFHSNEEENDGATQAAIVACRDFVGWLKQEED